MELLKTLYRKYPELLLLALGSLVFLTNLDALFVNIMEARNFITAREMLVHDNWIFTTMNELPRYQKPPLPTWLTAISARLFGIENVYAYRLPAALASLFLLLIFYKMQLQAGIHKALAFGTGIILMTSFYVFFAGREGQWDIFTHSFMIGSIYYFIKTFAGNEYRLKNSVIGGLFLGASLMSKGPVSLYALFLPFLISYSIVYKFEVFQKGWKYLAIFIALGLISGSWWSILIHYHDAEEISRVAALESGRWFNYNIRPIWYYWSFFTQSGIWTIPALMGLFYWHLKTRVSNLKAYRFFFLWTLFSLILLSIIPEKKSRYLLPVLIPLAATTGFYVEYAIRNFRDNFSKWERFPIYLNFIILALISIAAPIFLYISLEEYLGEMMGIFIFTGILLFALGAGFIYGLVRKKILFLFSLQAGMMILIIAVGSLFLKPIDPSRNSPNVAELKSFAQLEDLEVYDYYNLMPELIWHYGSSIPTIEEPASHPGENKFILLVIPEDYPNWQTDFRDYTIEKHGVLDLNPTFDKGKNLRLVREMYVITKQAP
ncbi:MAG: glycosyltransferase family 39 protein [Gillisia sp.]